MKRTISFTTAIVLAVGSGAAHAEGPDSNPISLEAIRAHTTFLADDLLEGRGTGSRGFMIAANYVASMFQASGVEPGAETGTYFQHVPLRHSTVSAAGTSVSLVRDGITSTFRYGEEFYATPGFRSARSSVSGGIAFVGYGVTAPDSDYDDYADIDVQGKIVVTINGAPPQFDDNPSAHYSSRALKAEIAAEHGAVGLINVWSGPTAASFPWETLGRFMRRGSMRWLDAAGEPNSPPAAIVASATVSEGAAQRILAGGSHSFENAAASLATGIPASFDVSGTLALNVASRHRDITSPNIVGRLEGSDPILRNEYVVYTAHVDHEGLGEPMDGDSIYNGAVDNAASTATLIEVARAMADLRPRPARSILFVGTTAEEEGLLGADYFASNPPVPASQIVANINMDGNHMLFPVADIIAFGDKHSTLGAVAISVRSYSRSSRSCVTSMWSNPRKPQRKPKPNAADDSGSKDMAGSFRRSFSSASRNSG